MRKIKIKGFDEVQEMLKEYREGGALELQQYRSIGTVEECREARERQRGKKVEYITDMKTLGMLNGICPVCGETIHIDRGCKSNNSYCINCGQKLDWSDTP